MADLGKEVLVLEVDPTPFERGLESAGGRLRGFDAQLAVGRQFDVGISAAPPKAPELPEALGAKALAEAPAARAKALAEAPAARAPEGAVTRPPAQLAAGRQLDLGVGGAPPKVPEVKALAESPAARVPVAAARAPDLGAAGKDLGAAGKDVGAAGKDVAQLQKDAERLTKSLEEQAATFGLTARQAALYKLELRGAGESDLAAAKAAGKHLESLERAKAAKSAGGAALRAGAGLLTQSLSSGRGPGTQDVIGAVQSVAGSLPGPLGSIASTITGVIGGVVEALSAETNRMRARVGDAFASVIDGSRTARQAVADVRANTISEGARDLANQRVDVETSNVHGAFDRVNTNLGNNAVADQLTTIMDRAERSQQLFTRLHNDPRMRQIVRTATEERIGRDLTGRTETMDQGAAQGQLQGEAMAHGRSVEEAADAAQRLAAAQQLAAASGISLEQAQGRLAAQLAQLADAQQRAREGAATRGVGQQIAASRQELDLLGRRAAFLRQDRGGRLAVDMSQEEAELERMRRLGAAPQVIAARQAQLGQVRESRINEMAAQQGAQLRQELRNPLEEFEAQRTHLESLRAHNGIDDETFARGLDRAAQNLERAAGEAPSGQAALQEGSAAAASAILKAQRQQERDDRPERLRRSVEELRAVAVQQRDRQRELVDLVRNGDIFRVANV